MDLVPTDKEEEIGEAEATGTSEERDRVTLEVITRERNTGYGQSRLLLKSGFSQHSDCSRAVDRL